MECRKTLKQKNFVIGQLGTLLEHKEADSWGNIGMSDHFFDSTIGGLNTSLNARQLKQNVHTSNVTNADTPGYKAKAVEFETELRQAMQVGDELPPAGTHPKHIVPRETDPINPEVYDDPNGVESLDGNTVDRARELGALAENQILYNSSVEMLKRKLGMLRYAISEGGGNR